MVQMSTSSPNRRYNFLSRAARIWSSPWVATSAVVAALLLLSMQLWHISLFGPAIDYKLSGNWAEMIGGVASALAVIVAVSSIAAEQRRATEEKTAARIQELTRIYCWLEWGVGSDRKHAWVLKFQNENRVPVFKWQVQIDGVVSVYFESSHYGPIRPDSSEILVNELAGVAPDQQPSIVFDFIDPSGACWRRPAEGMGLTPLVSLAPSGGEES